jgi:hypothetical protein
VAPEKKFAILSFRDGVLGAAAAVGAGGWAAPVAAGPGGAAAVEAVVAGVPMPPPLHPASNKNTSAAAAGDLLGDQWRQPDPGNMRFVPRVIANLRSPIAIANL